MLNNSPRELLLFFDNNFVCWRLCCYGFQFSVSFSHSTFILCTICFIIIILYMYVARKIDRYIDICISFCVIRRPCHINKYETKSDHAHFESSTRGGENGTERQL